ncbi:FecR family protein [Taibaiella koreensis]|uniref:FecR family protein n=1 Tax=Taibaiella koreensis TaxID=1268548 RepID=UPI0013C34BA6|nr:FecR domain-containing protein [Taibaiella koreensis]
MDELLVKYLLGEASADEERMVLEWTHAKEEHRRYYDHFKVIWEQSRALAATSTVDEEQAWDRFKAKRDGLQHSDDHLVDSDDNNSDDNTVVFIPAKKRRWTSMAAAIALLITGSLVAYYFMALNRQDIVLASAGEVLTDTLPDGSVVTLNKNSTLAYAKDFNKHTRAVKLTGEAFFNVAPNKQKPFEISVDEVKVQVVGTSFNVKNGAEQTEVIVETGIVNVGVSDKAVRVLPQQRVVVHKKQKALDVQKSQDDLYNYYRTKEFVCYKTPLYKLAEALNIAYDVKIVIPEERVRNLTLSTTYKNMPLNGILNLVTKQFNLSIEQKDGEIILK